MIEIPLTKGKVTIVDDCDAELTSVGWCAKGAGARWYAVRTGWKENKKFVQMHRVIVGALPGQIVDHVDGDGLNNQRSNLRIVSHAENMQNRRPKKNGTSPFLGVCWYSAIGKWRAGIKHNHVQKCLGDFDSEVEAAMAYDEAARELHGEFARLNFPYATARELVAKRIQAGEVRLALPQPDELRPALKAVG